MGVGESSNGTGYHGNVTHLHRCRSNHSSMERTVPDTPGRRWRRVGPRSRKYQSSASFKGNSEKYSSDGEGMGMAIEVSKDGVLMQLGSDSG